GDWPFPPRQRDQGRPAGSGWLSPALELVASQATVLVAGYALLSALGVAELRAADARLVGLTYLAGCASTGLLVPLALILGLGESLPGTVVLVAGQTVSCFWMGRKTKPLGLPAIPACCKG